MARASTIRTLAGIYEAFFHQKTWKQADLARRVGVRSETLRQNLEALQDEGWPLEREEEPPQVYWSLPRDYFGDSVMIPGAEVPRLLRLLAYSRDSPERARLVERLAPGPVGGMDALVGAPSLSSDEESILLRLEESLREQAAVDGEYYSASRGALEWRKLSVQRIAHDGPVRVVGYCHRDETLKWFRLSSFKNLRACDVPYHPIDREAVDTFLEESLNGFHGGEPRQTYAFAVRNPTARWVTRNLLAGMRTEPTADGVRVMVETSSRVVVARFVLQVADAVTEMSPELRDDVRRLAEAALAI